MKKITTLLIAIFALLMLCACVSNAPQEHVHSFGEWTTTKQPTCTDSGERERLCSCGEKQVQTIPATGHSYGEWTTIKEATCEEPGEQERICSCGDKQTQTIPATGHKEGALITDTAATCTEAGSGHTECTRCGITIKTQTIPAKGHVAGSWIIDKEATCKDTGSKHKVCTVCGTVTNTESIPTTGVHTVNNPSVKKAATCTENGTSEGVCSVCGKTVTGIIKALGHDYGSNNVCKRCGAVTFNMTEKEKEAARNISSMSHSCYAYSSYIQFSITFKDDSGYTLRAPAYVDVRIVNTKGATVYKQTLVKTSTSDELKINYTDIPAGAVSTGTVYYRVYNPGYASFDEIGKDVDSLPWTVKIQLPKTPNTYHDYNYNNKIRYSCKVTSIRYEVSGDDLYIYITGEKTYDIDGSKHGASCHVGWKLYDEDGYVVGSGTFYTNSLCVGDKFRDCEVTAYNCIEQGKSYRLEFSSVE